jgi:hypothetical protein
MLSQKDTAAAVFSSALVGGFSGVFHDRTDTRSQAGTLSRRGISSQRRKKAVFLWRTSESLGVSGYGLSNTVHLYLLSTKL